MAKLLSQTQCHRKSPTKSTLHTNILAQQDDSFIAPHFFQKGRPFSFPSSSCRFLHRLINGLNVIAIDGPAWNSIGCGTIADLLDFHDLMNRGGGTILVVLADKDHRQIPDGGHVEGLMKA